MITHFLLPPNELNTFLCLTQHYTQVKLLC